MQRYDPLDEAGWQKVIGVGALLQHLTKSASPRKLRLLLAACVRHSFPPSPDADMIAAAHVAEQFADGKADSKDLGQVRRALAKSQPARGERWAPKYTENIKTVPAWHVLRETIFTAVYEGAQTSGWSTTRKKDPSGGVIADFPEKECAAQADLLREIFGNPFRPIALNPRWLTSNVVDLAGAIYEERAFERMPILADALMDAGCDSEEIIAHCRGNGPHVRGCWVDLLLSKE